MVEDKDNFAKFLGFKVLELGQGFAKVLGHSSETSLNGAGVVHGGYIYTLADYAFALITNTDEHIALSSNATINYMEAVKPNTVLLATAKLSHEKLKTSICDIVITDETSKTTYAIFQARAIYKPRV